MNDSLTGPVVCFDGHCNLCNRWVQWVLKRDKQAVFRFAPLASKWAQAHLDLKSLPDSVILVEGNQVLSKSAAVIGIFKQLGGLCAWGSVFSLIPMCVRDAVYDWIALHRIHWFGKADTCWVMRDEWRNRFLD